MNGFTLVELLVVLALVAMLATSAAPHVATAIDEPPDAPAMSQMVSACLRIAAQSRGRVALRASAGGSRFAVTDRMSAARYVRPRPDTMQLIGRAPRAVCAPDGFVWQPHGEQDILAAPGRADAR